MAGFAIYEVAVGGGRLALSPMIGRGGGLAVVTIWAPDLVISMVELHELKGCAVASELAPAKWVHFPVKDYGVPDVCAEHEWAQIATQVRDILANGGRVLVHCRGGCGRSGMAVLRLMIAAGNPADMALARLHEVRPCAVETEAQLAWAYLDCAGA